MAPDAREWSAGSDENMAEVESKAAMTLLMQKYDSKRRGGGGRLTKKKQETPTKAEGNIGVKCASE